MAAVRVSVQSVEYAQVDQITIEESLALYMWPSSESCVRRSVEMQTSKSPNKESYFSLKLIFFYSGLRPSIFFLKLNSKAA